MSKRAAATKANEKMKLKDDSYEDEEEGDIVVANPKKGKAPAKGAVAAKAAPVKKARAVQVATPTTPTTPKYLPNPIVTQDMVDTAQVRVFHFKISLLSNPDNCTYFKFYSEQVLF